MKKTTISNIVRAQGVALVAFAIALCLPSCTQDAAINDLVTPDVAGVKTQITLDVDAQIDSRVSVNELAFSWESDDVLYVYGATDPFTINSDDAGSSNGSFTGALSLGGEPQYIYAIYDPIKGGVNYSSDDEGVKYTITQKVTQTQNIGTGGVNNPNSIGNQFYMYGKSNSQIDTDNTTSGITMHHTTAVQDFVFSNLPTADNGAMVKMIFSSTKPMLADAIVNLDTDEIVGGSSTVSNITITVTPKADDDRSLLTAPTIRVAILPQTIVAAAEWSIYITMEDGAQYQYTFGTASSDFDFEAGNCYQTSIDWNDMTEVLTDDAGLSLATFTVADVADTDLWVFDNALISTATEIDNLDAVLAAVKEADPTREITVKFSNLTSIGTTSLFEGTPADHFEFPALTTISSSNNKIFCNCLSLKSVSMPLVKGDLGTNIFYGCSSLISVNAPEGESGVYLDGITLLGNYSFSYCSSMVIFSAPDVTYL